MRMRKATWRTKLIHLAMVALAVLAALSAFAQDGNILQNSGFEDAANDKPAKWNAQNWRTGGKPTVGTDGGHTGKGYAILESGSTKERAAFQQKVKVPEGTKSVDVGGWYRTRGIKQDKNRGAALRILFHRNASKWDEISLKIFVVPPTENWTEFQKTLPLPEGTVAVVMETFNFFGPGQAHWDDVWVRPSTKAAAKAPKAAPKQAGFGPGTEIDRPPVKGTNKPYSPADGSRVALNPPPFLWLPSGKTGEVTYNLQIDTSPKFDSGNLIEHKGMIWRCKMLTRQLKPGTWYWRYGVDGKTPKTAWSKTRKFTVPKNANPWVYPGRDSFKVGPRPRMFVQPGGLAELRRRAKEGDLKDLANALVINAQRRAGDKLIEEPAFLPKDRSERGKAYTKTFWATRPPMDQMERAGLAYLLTGDKKSGLEAKRRILHFFKWNPTGSTDIMHNDEPAMWVMMRGTRAYDWTYDLFTPEERKIVEDSMRVRARRFYEQLSGMPYDNRPYSSHPSRTIGFLGEAAISFLPDWPEARDYLEYITQIYWGVYPAWGTDDGGWNEGPGYWGAYMSFGLHFVVALKQATGVDLSERPFFHNTPYYRLYITPPHSAMSPFGDGTQWKPSLPGALMYQFSSINRDPVIRWYADTLGKDGGGSILGVVLKDDSLKGQPPVNLPSGILFDGVGLASLHTDLVNGDRDIHFAFKSSPYGAVSHGHNEQNCFVLEAYGSALAVNTGYYNRYGSPHHDKWTRQTKAKNGITFDGGQSQDRGWHATGHIESFVHGEGFDLIVGDAKKAWGGRLTKCMREVVHVRPGIFVIRDDVADDEPHTYEFRLHAIEKMEVNPAEKTIFTKEQKATLLTRFLVPEQVKIAQTDKFDTPPTWPPDRKYVNNWHATTSIAKPAKEAEFLTVLQVSRPDEKPEPATARTIDTDKVRGVELKHDDGSRTLVGFAKVGAVGPFALESIETDAPIFAVTFGDKGEAISWLGRNCTTLRAGGKELVRTEKPMTVTAMPDTGFGRVDTDGQGGRVKVWWPWKAKWLARGKNTMKAERDGDAVAFEAEYGRDRVAVWEEKPGAEGEIKVTAVFGGKKVALTGQRYMSGIGAVSGKIDAPGGVYRMPELPKSVSVQLGDLDRKGRVWVRGTEAVSLTGRRLPRRVEFPLVAAVAKLPVQDQSKIPAGLAREAEKGYMESSKGGVSLSGGGHKNVSGGDNLWAWNTPGHSIMWDVDVPEAGKYELWVVGASECGLLMDMRMDDAESLPLWFEATGGWGRSVAREWAAYHVTDASGKPVRFDLKPGTHRLKVTNHSGLGLNLDRFVLVKK